MDSNTSTHRAVSNFQGIDRRTNKNRVNYYIFISPLLKIKGLQSLTISLKQVGIFY